jgi:hypothetical protein
MRDFPSGATPARDYNRCPLPATHRRLAEAHLLWHQALQNYQHPDAFRANLNSTIQALRNVTFALQSEKHSIINFDTWYGDWQRRLAADPLARWLIAARNIVVKQGDLDLSSEAVVRLLTWKDDLLIQSPIPPGASAELVLNNLPLLELIKGTALPVGDLQNAALEIERRWSVADLQGHEILESLAPIYGQLSDCVLDAHARAGGFPCIPVASSHPDFRSPYHRTGTLPCMAITRDERTDRIELATGKHYQVATETRPVIDANLEKAARRYGLLSEPGLSSWQGSDPLAVAKHVLYRAQKILRRDKGLVRMMFIRDGYGTWHQTALYAADRTEKHILMRVVAAFIERVGADALVDVGESWKLPADAAHELEFHEMQDAPSRQEVLHVLVATREGLLKTYETPFSRGPFGGIKLATTSDSDPGTPYYLAPVVDVWRRQGRRAGTSGETFRQVWEPDPLDTCFCGGPERFGECCKTLLEQLRTSNCFEREVTEASQAGNVARLEALARASLAQYVIWIKQHTAATRHVAHELHLQLIEVDVPALQAYVGELRKALAASGHSQAFVPALLHLSKIVGVPEVAVRLTALAAQSLWNTGDHAGAARELGRLGRLDEVKDSLALVLATRLLDLPNERIAELLDRAAETAYSEGETMSARLELVRHLLRSGDKESALLGLESVISMAGAQADNRSLLASALALRWEMTNDDADFLKARVTLETLSPEEHWRELASILVDHGDYDEAEAVLASPLKEGDVAAHLLAIDARLRAGKTTLARELFLALQPDRISPGLVYPYAYTTGLLALACNDSELKRTAISNLRKVVAADTPTVQPAKEMLAALEDADASSGSIVDRLRKLVGR